jgi:hypothetical protein
MTTGQGEQGPISPNQWRKQVNADRSLTQSAKRLASWLTTQRQVDQQFKGGQRRAADALGLTVRTVYAAEKLLIDRGYLERCERGVRQRRYSRFKLLKPEDLLVSQHATFAGPRHAGQHEVGGVLKEASQHAEIARSKTMQRYDVDPTTGLSATADLLSNLAQTKAEASSASSRACGGPVALPVSALANTRLKSAEREHRSIGENKSSPETTNPGTQPRTPAMDVLN